MTKLTQCEMVLKYLQEGRLMTSHIAFRVMGIISLPKRIQELKEQGYDIRSYRVKLPGGKSCNSYFLISRKAIENAQAHLEGG